MNKKKLKKLFKKTAFYRFLFKRIKAAEYRAKTSGSFHKEFRRLCSYKNISISSSKRIKKAFRGLRYFADKREGVFYYHIDEKIFLITNKSIIGNIPLDYRLILDNTILSLIPPSDKQLKDAIIGNIDAIIHANKDSKSVSDSFSGLLTRKANSFQDALQRILYANQLVWQTKHYLIGLGRLDLLLDNYYKEDIKAGLLTEEKARNLIDEFLLLLHQNYAYKSNTLMGDTGQIIILGGKMPDGTYFSNDLTSFFIQEIMKLQIPDPKVLLRTSSSTPGQLMDLAVDCVSTGIGGPLFANDDVIIPSLGRIGYNPEDVFYYGVSACWEPLIIGKSIDQNNVGNFNLAKCVNDTVSAGSDIKSFDSLLDNLKSIINREIHRIVAQLDETEYEKDPVLSLFIDKKVALTTDYDLFQTAYYCYFGILCPGFSNGIDGLLALDQLVFKDKTVSLSDLNNDRIKDFSEYGGLFNKVRLHYGMDDDQVILLTNKILSFMDEACAGLKNKYGFQIKFGLSSPNYMLGESNEASFDGRKSGKPYNVHISSATPLPYTELLNFASKLNYSGFAMNGNVVDLMVSPSFIQENKDKFELFLIKSVQNGFFELQMNVVSSKMLIDAKAHPEKYQNLIVRVWGFSAYFKDLPVDYQDYLIKRAIQNESAMQ
jgi:pyruvate-formate lyase